MRIFHTHLPHIQYFFFSAPYQHGKEEKALEFFFEDRPDLQSLTYSSYIIAHMIQTWALDKSSKLDRPGRGFWTTGAELVFKGIVGLLKLKGIGSNSKNSYIITIPLQHHSK